MACLADLFASDFDQGEAVVRSRGSSQPVVGELNLYPEDVTQLLAKRAVVARAVESMTL